MGEAKETAGFRAARIMAWVVTVAWIAFFVIGVAGTLSPGIADFVERRPAPFVTAAGCVVVTAFGVWIFAVAVALGDKRMGKGSRRRWLALLLLLNLIGAPLFVLWGYPRGLKSRTPGR